MKALFKRWISIILLLAVLSSAALPALAAETYSVIRVFCVSNCYNTPDSAVDLLLYRDEAYIRAEDAANYSGFMLNTAEEKLEFTRKDEKVGFSMYLSDGVDSWIPLFSGMELLDTQLEVDSGVLWFTARKHTFRDLREITDEMVSNPYLLEKLFEGSAGSWGKFGAWLINLVSNDPVEELMASIGGAVSSGDYSQSKSDYQAAIMMLLESSENDPYLHGIELEYEYGKDILKAAKKIVKLVKKLPKIDEYIRKLASNKELMDLLEEASYQDLPGSSLAGLLGSKSMKYYLNTASKATSDNLKGKIENYTNGIVKINGLDISSQLDIAQYMYSLYSAGTAYRDMFLNTYYGAEGNIEYAPALARSIIKDIKESASEDKGDDIWNLVTEEATSLLKGSTKETVRNLIKKGLFKGNGTYTIYKIAKSAAVFCVEAATGFTTKKSAKYVTQGAALAEIQSGIKEMYDRYKDDEENALIVKYAALLYNRCYQLVYEMLCDMDNSTPIIINEQELILLSQISDRDLTAKVSNTACSADELMACAELYRQSQGVIIENEADEEESRMELTAFLGMPLEQLISAVPDCEANEAEKSFSTPNAVVKGSYDADVKSVRLLLTDSSALNYQICGIYPGMTVEQGLNILNAQGFQMEIEDGMWVGRSGGIEVKFFGTLGNSISNIGADKVPPETAAIDLTQYLGTWENKEQEVCVYIFDCGEDYVNFSLDVYRLNSVNDQVATMISGNKFAFAAEDEYQGMFIGNLYFGEGAITLDVSYNDFMYMDYLVGQDILLTPYMEQRPVDTCIEAAHYFPMSSREILRSQPMSDLEDGCFADEDGGLFIAVEDDEIIQMTLDEAGKYSLFGMQPGMSEAQAVSALENFDGGALEVRDICWDYGMCEAYVYYDGVWIADLLVFAECDTVEEISAYVSEGDSGAIDTAAVVNCEEWVSLREYADTGSRRLEQVYLGEFVDVYGYEGDFAYCEYNGSWGYILSDYLMSVSIIHGHGDDYGSSAEVYECYDGFATLTMYDDGSFNIELALYVAYGNVEGSYSDSDGQVILWIESRDFSGFDADEYETLYLERRGEDLILDCAYGYYSGMLYGSDIYFGEVTGGSYFERVS